MAAPARRRLRWLLAAGILFAGPWIGAFAGPVGVAGAASAAAAPPMVTPTTVVADRSSGQGRLGSEIVGGALVATMIAGAIRIAVLRRRQRHAGGDGRGERNV